jgi:probable HAF family extracellular repeat protein
VVWAKDATGKYVMTDLGRGHATGINNNGEVLARGTLIQPVTINGHMVWYQDLNGDGFNDLAIPLVVGGSALNDNTQIVAGYNIMTFVAGNQVVTPLPGYGTGNAINNNGQVAGYSGGIANGTFPAAIWQTDAAGNLLGAVFLNGQAGSSAATAMCLDQLGNAAGRSEFPVPNSMPPALRFRATLWKNAGPPIDLGAPSRSSSQVQGASTINGALQLVGWVSNGSSYAFLWQNGKLTDLNTLVSVSGSLREADAINANGQIVGVARVPVGKSDYEAHAFLITPK